MIGGGEKNEVRNKDVSNNSTIERIWRDSVDVGRNVQKWHCGAEAK